MSLLLLFHPREDEDPPDPPDTVPFRNLMGVGLTLVFFAFPFLAIF